MVLLMVLSAISLLALLAAAVPERPPQGQAAPDPVGALVARLEQSGIAGDRNAILNLGVLPVAAGLAGFADLADPRPTRFVVKERDRSPAEDGSERLLLEVFEQRDTEARISTWRLDAVRATHGEGRDWAIGNMERLSVISGLYRLDLNPAKQFEVRNLTVTAPDLTLDLPSGSAFVAETPEGPTAIVLLGRGTMRFAPADSAEQTQVRIFSGKPALDAEFDAVFLRIRPGEFEHTIRSSSLVPRAVSRGDLRRAGEFFEEFIGRTLQLDLTDLSRERWSLTPTSGDLIAEVRTRKHGSLTYARAGKDAEDISLFDRRRRRNIAAYASAEKLATRGRSYNEDDLTEYDILHHDLEATFAPDRFWIDGRARILLRVRSYALTTLTFRLAEALTVRSVVSPEFGRLLHLRVVGQNSIIVNLPAVVTRNTEMWLQVIYSGRLEPQAIEREAIAAGEQQQEAEPIQIRLEPQYLYSNRSYWHPQSTVTDYATSRVRLMVPPDYDVVASGRLTAPPAPVAGPVEAGQRARQAFLFETERPARYIACVISRFTSVSTTTVTVPSPAGTLGSQVTLSVQANPRQTGKGRSLGERAVEIVEFYGSLIGDLPYPGLTLAITEGELPGGHSPPYFAVVNQTHPMSPLVWRNDPVSFDNYPTFFLAHEIAHQWWGQAIGWKNYHEQWISEGFAQYFAALYAAEERGDDLLDNVMRQMRRWAIEQSSQGPIYLGYRLGHIRGDGRVFRAILYNKSAMVLHMLRRLVGDEVFFAGLRRFYTQWRFRKAGTEDFRAAMEAAGAPGMEPFFEAWIYGTAIPEVRFSYQINGPTALLRFEHRREVIPVPITVTVNYADGSSEELVVPVLERTTEHSLTIRGTIRSIDTNRDNAALAEISR
jgi:hypothetical protein